MFCRMTGLRKLLGLCLAVSCAMIGDTLLAENDADIEGSKEIQGRKLETLPDFYVGETYLWKGKPGIDFEEWWYRYVNEVRQERGIAEDAQVKVLSRGWYSFYDSWYRGELRYQYRWDNGKNYAVFENINKELDSWLANNQVDDEQSEQIRADLLKAWEVVNYAHLAYNEKNDPAIIEKLNLPDTLKKWMAALAIRVEEMGDKEIAMLQELSETAEPEWQAMQIRAHFILGLYWLEKDNDKAIEHFDRIQEKHQQGMPDPENCLAQSQGWRTRILYLDRNYFDALKGYVEGFIDGYEDRVSILWTLRRIDNADIEELQRLAADPVLSRVMTTYLLDYGLRKRELKRRDNFLQDWLPLVWDSPYLAKEEEWLLVGAWRLGWKERCRERLEQSGLDSMVSNFLRARFSIEDGDEEQAIQSYQRALEFEKERDEEVRGRTTGARDGGTIIVNMDSGRGYGPSGLRLELGALYLKRDQYPEALEQFLYVTEGDSAMLAERILTTEELIQFAKQLVVENVMESDDREVKYEIQVKRDRAAWLYHLLARRLAREGQWDESIVWFQRAQTVMEKQRYSRIKFNGLRQDAQKVADWYKELESGMEDEQRAVVLWNLAQKLRHCGLELMGTELHPDYVIHGGSFPYLFYYFSEIFHSNGRFPLSDQTVQRIENSVSKPNSRFHYRYIAADYGWQAAQLLPNNDVRTAFILWESGTWLKYLNPKQADRFYKSLVTRNRNTEIGKEADLLRWFPSYWIGDEPEWGNQVQVDETTKENDTMESNTVESDME